MKRSAAARALARQVDRLKGEVGDRLLDLLDGSAGSAELQRSAGQVIGDLSQAELHLNNLVEMLTARGW